MKKGYKKPVVAYTDMEKGKTFSNSEAYGEWILCQDWMKEAEGLGIAGLAEELVRYRANPEYIYREIAGESVLIPSGKAAQQFSGLASLNKTGAFLWELLGRERSLRELGRALGEEYELTEEQSTEDVKAFLELGLSRELIIRC